MDAIVGDQNKSTFPPLGVKLFFLANIARKFFLSCPPAWSPYHFVEKQKFTVFLVDQNYLLLSKEQTDNSNHIVIC